MSAPQEVLDLGPSPIINNIQTDLQSLLEYCWANYVNRGERSERWIELRLA